MRRMFVACGVVYITIYAFEGPIRYGLNLLGADAAIFVRDGLLILPVAALLTAQAFRLRVHPAYIVFAAVIAVHGGLMYANLHSWQAVVYGAKILIGTLFGFLVAGALIQPGRRLLQLYGLLFVITLIGLTIDKYVTSFPWLGLTTHIGGLTVDISRDWETGTTGLSKRAAGFTHISIAAAVLVPVLALVIAPRIRSWTSRLLVLCAALAGVFFTTQKGSLVTMVPVALILCGPRSWRYPLMAVLCSAFAFFVVALPIATGGMLLSDHGGVFSTATFAMRIIDTWPDAWQWIVHNQIFPLGVGLGGIGGAQRLYAFDYQNPADNLFLLLYAWFGLLGVVYLAWPVIAAWRVPRAERPEALAALALLTFLLGYGTVITVLEDPLAAIMLGATAGTLWQCRQRALGRAWADAFSQAQPDALSEPPITPEPGVAVARRRRAPYEAAEAKGD
jgi:hypothetical protein